MWRLLRTQFNYCNDGMVIRASHGYISWRLSRFAPGAFSTHKLGTLGLEGFQAQSDNDSLINRTLHYK